MRRLAAPAALAASLLLAAMAAALTVRNPSPLWLEEHFTDTAAVALSGGACVDTAPPGTARLCRLAWGVAADPSAPRLFAWRRDGQAGLYAFDGSGMTGVVPALPPPVPAAVYDASWGTDALALLTVDGWVYGYAQGAEGGLAPLPGWRAQAPGAVSAASGPGVLLAAAPAGITAWSWGGSQLVRTPALDLAVSAAMIRLSRDGTRLLAVLPDGRLQTWGRAEAGWVPGPGLPAPVLAADFMPSGAGLWATSGQEVRAYGFTQDGGLAEIPSWRIAAPARAVAGGFGGQDAVLALDAALAYWGAGPDGAAQVPAYSTALPSGEAHEPSGTVTGAAYQADHQVDMLRVEALETLPPGTATAYEVSTDCGAAWTPSPVNTNVPVPPGSCVAWRLTLSTGDPAATPEVDAVDVYEIAAQTRQAQPGEVVMRLIN